MKRLEGVFEAILWNSRFVTLVAVLASLLGAFALSYVAALDVAALFGNS